LSNTSQQNASGSTMTKKLFNFLSIGGSKSDTTSIQDIENANNDVRNNRYESFLSKITISTEKVINVMYN